ncbi:VOC family protein [Bacillus massilinigeriensis]|uniref:VOC family protein n=1 Tax=Bacillus mediterraneensis TaxID=1805474 RepID=UPI0008F9608B|nr:VOC family protein [Bacillus mediterraneensis]
MISNLYPYLVMNGNGQEAVQFYSAALDAKILKIQTFGEMPSHPDHPLPPGAKDRVLNAHLKVGEFDLMLSDTFPGQDYDIGSQVTVAVMVNGLDKTKEVFDKLKDGGKELMALQPTFWSPLYGQVTDKFGVTWQVSAENQPQ